MWNNLRQKRRGVRRRISSQSRYGQFVSIFFDSCSVWLSNDRIPSYFSHRSEWRYAGNRSLVAFSARGRLSIRGYSFPDQPLPSRMAWGVGERGSSFHRLFHVCRTALFPYRQKANKKPSCQWLQDGFVMLGKHWLNRYQILFLDFYTERGDIRLLKLWLLFYYIF